MDSEEKSGGSDNELWRKMLTEDNKNCSFAFLCLGLKQLLIYSVSAIEFYRNTITLRYGQKLQIRRVPD